MHEVILHLFPPAWFETFFGRHCHLHVEGQKAALKYDKFT